MKAPIYLFQSEYKFLINSFASFKPSTAFFLIIFLKSRSYPEILGLGSTKIVSPVK